MCYEGALKLWSSEREVMVLRKGMFGSDQRVEEYLVKDSRFNLNKWIGCFFFFFAKPGSVIIFQLITANSSPPYSFNCLQKAVPNVSWPIYFQDNKAVCFPRCGIDNGGEPTDRGTGVADRTTPWLVLGHSLAVY